MGDLSAHFSKSEFACPHCNRSFVDGALITGLEKLRVMAGHAVHILSGYRCATHNKKIGGGQSSMHLAGKAADIQIDQLDAMQTLTLVKQIPEFTGYGLYVLEHFCHVDARPLVKGHKPETWARIDPAKGYVSLAEGEKAWERSQTKAKR